MNLLHQLKAFSTVVADTGDWEAIRQFQPQDATTNPSIILKTVRDHSSFLHNILANNPGLTVQQIMDRLFVAMGVEILKVIPGRVSTEVDAHLSFDMAATIRKTHELIDLYAQNGIPSERVLIKIAATWEGIQAAAVLEKEGIHCNMTLIFSPEQAIACAEAGVTLISPFVGRILDWYQVNCPEVLVNGFDPGVDSVKKIYHYYKKFHYKTEIMAASFRNINEITELAGCDLLTISPKLLNQLAQTDGEIKQNIHEFDGVYKSKIILDESEFRLRLNENQMATEKLSEGIRLFCFDIRQLEQLMTE